MALAKDVSFLVMGRSEQFMRNTVDDVLSKIRGDSEVIAIADGCWPDPVLRDHPRLHVLHFTEAIGQRAATNVGAALSRAKYICKLDAHCMVDDGMDVKLMADCKPDWTMVPSMHRLHIFDWACSGCGERVYQGIKPNECAVCKGTEFYMHMVWQPRFQYEPTVSWRFDRTLHFQYWREHRKRPDVQKQIQAGLLETMSCIGACFFMERKRFLDLGGMDERHGSWGQYGTELACKAWLSGGKMVTSLKTWFAHLFRTGNFSANGQSSWPYPISQGQIDKAREYSRDLWLNDKWPMAVRKLSWLVDHFAPVPDWHEKET